MSPETMVEDITGLLEVWVAGWAGCRAPYLGCIVNGYDPGAIDSFTATGSPAKAEADTSEIVAAFRCVWEGAS